MIIKTFPSPLMDSNMYLIFENKSVFIIDPFKCDEALNMINNVAHKLEFVVLTHEHYDHISGVNWFKGLFNCNIICSKECSKRISEPKRNFSDHFDVLVEMYGKKQSISSARGIQPYSCNADNIFEESLSIEWQGHDICLYEAPGHSTGSIIIQLDKKILFTGDSLLKNYPTLTRFPGGSTRDFKEVTIPLLKAFQPDSVVYPGHYDSFILSEKLSDLL